MNRSRALTRFQILTVGCVPAESGSVPLIRQLLCSALCSEKLDQLQTYDAADLAESLTSRTPGGRSPQNLIEHASGVEFARCLKDYDYHVVNSCARKPVQNERNPYPALEKFFQE
jgi:hypothetical protein